MVNQVRWHSHVLESDSLQYIIYPKTQQTHLFSHFTKKKFFRRAQIFLSYRRESTIRLAAHWNDYLWAQTSVGVDISFTENCATLVKKIMQFSNWTQCFWPLDESLNLFRKANDSGDVVRIFFLIVWAFITSFEHISTYLATFYLLNTQDENLMFWFYLITLRDQEGLEIDSNCYDNLVSTSSTRHLMQNAAKCLVRQQLRKFLFCNLWNFPNDP